MLFCGSLNVPKYFFFHALVPQRKVNPPKGQMVHRKRVFAFPAFANGYTRCYFPALANGYKH